MVSRGESSAAADALRARRSLEQTGGRSGFRVSRDYIARNPQADPTATELAINLFFTAELLGRRMDQVLRPVGLTRGSLNVLQILGGAARPLTPGEITPQLVATSATVTGLIDTLEARGLVVRRAHPTDRRSVLVAITPHGRALLDELVPQLIEREKAWAAGLEPAAREELVCLLGALEDHLRGMGEEPTG